MRSRCLADELDTLELFLLLEPAEANEVLVLFVPVPRSENWEEVCLRSGRGVAEIMESMSGLEERSGSWNAEGGKDGFLTGRANEGGGEGKSGID